MKKVLTIVAITLIALSSQAQKSEGFGMQATIGYGFNLQENFPGLFQISALPGWHFGSRWFAGLGLSYNLYTAKKGNGGNSTVIPIYAHGTFNITEGKKVTPFLNLRMGYGIHSEKISEGNSYAKTSGGFYIAPAFGVKMPVAKDVQLSLSLAYEAQNIAVEVDAMGVYAKTNQTFDNLMIRLGIEF